MIFLFIFFIVGCKRLLFVEATTVTMPTTATTTRRGGLLPVLLTTGAFPNSASLVTINGQLVRMVSNCTVHDFSTCPTGSCCTKTFLQYPAGYSGAKPDYQLECKPLLSTGEYCYFNTPENYCPCATKCHTNGFYGMCL
ncbi:uncharacterized protein LOC127843862 [Dreissena polymorpha]|uniref:Uncharacterized protein n=1 Tax=Dreissena polymorpha TaxID=45954 RepID=A0A9D4IIH5_DREPO|nr:uncharacterized protein LOC127843862 [Dreissena polymorpha]KAH3774319.1 hypothetical protein DPMN_175698 [Dreissena polymorpha]